jgi:hypothetical protein
MELPGRDLHQPPAGLVQTIDGDAVVPAVAGRHDRHQPAAETEAGSQVNIVEVARRQVLELPASQVVQRQAPFLSVPRITLLPGSFGWTQMAGSWAASPSCGTGSVSALATTPPWTAVEASLGPRSVHPVVSRSRPTHTRAGPGILIGPS